MSDFFIHPLSTLPPDARDVARANAQIRVNTLNAQKSTGPKTEEGKRIAAQNAL